MDECDVAAVQADYFQKQALKQLEGHSTGESLSECVDCGEEIPEARREAAPGCVRCVSCAAEHERTGP